MPKSLVREPAQQDVNNLLQSARGDALPMRQIADAVSAELGCTTAVVITLMPRGTLQIAQPPRLPDALLRGYSKDFHLFDRVVWEAITRGTAVRAEDSWPAGQFQSSRYFSEFLQVNGLRFAAAAPMKAPVLAGYPGALVVFRTDQQGAFNDEQLRQLAGLAGDLDDAMQRVREHRKGAAGTSSHSGEPRKRPLRTLPSVRVFVLDGSLQPRVGESEFLELDPSLRNNMLDVARQRLGHVNGQSIATDRVSLPDATGDLWNFRVVMHSSYPGLGEGPFVLFCMQPECSDWNVLRPGDFAADQELSRLIPAMKFMQEQFHRGPTLHEIAKTVHLSPFHFHRRFTELLGITPKHFLLDCQIEEAKDQLLARRKELAEIATDCGFAHQSHFTSRFKQATGLTPTRWRRVAVDSKK